MGLNTSMKVNLSIPVLFTAKPYQVEGLSYVKTEVLKLWFVEPWGSPPSFLGVRGVAHVTLRFHSFIDSGGCGSLEVKVSDRGRHVMSSNLVPLKILRVGKRCTLNLSRAQMSSRWCSVVVRRGERKLRCVVLLT
ncbi:hypothetical protein TNCV_855791 [Trichonephila clavipes]|nr:hypothetical protein TNCV_855791 [Trichonephila clavipes]